MPTRAARPITAILAGALLAAAPPAGGAVAQEAGTAAAKAPELGGPEGAIETARRDRPFDRYALPVAAIGPDPSVSLRPLEGRVIWSAYRLADPDASAAAVQEGYRKRLAELGFEPIFECANAACGGFDFRFGVQLLPAPAMLLDTAEFTQLSARRKGAEAERSFASILVSRVLDAVYVQAVMVLPAEAARPLAPAPRADTAAQALALPRDRATLFAQLSEHGHVALQGLDFETGGATLSASSDAALETAAQLLRDHPELSIVIVGHSDNQGALDANIALSKRRAEAVRAALIARGVVAARLEAQGAGYLAPVTSNVTPEGRALNRRVELVLR